MKTNKHNASEILFTLAFVILIAIRFLQQTMFSEKYAIFFDIYKFGIYFSCILLTIKFMIEKHNIKDFFLKVLFMFLGIIISWYSNSSFTVIPLFLLIINMSTIDFEKMLIVWFKTIFLLMLLIAFSYYFKIIGEPIRVVRRISGNVRYGLGYIYPSFQANYLFYLSIIYIYIRKIKIKYFEILTLFLINLIVYIYTDTKSAFLYCVLLLCLTIFVKIKGNVKYNSFINKYIIFITGTGVIFLSYLYNVNISILAELNRIVTGRIGLAHNALEQFGIKLFGQKIEWTTETIINFNTISSVVYNYVDSSFLNILINYGLIFLLFIVFGYYYVSRLSITKNIFYTNLLLVIALHAMFDPQLMLINYNPTILLLGYMFSEKLRIENKNE